MLLFQNKDHALHCPRGEISSGELIAPYESTARVDAVLAGLARAGLGESRPSRDFGDSPIEAVHREDYLSFLRSAWTDWLADGHGGEIVPNIWPSHSMAGRGRPPREMEGRVGYYALAGETSIVEGTWQAAYGSAQTALSAVDAVASGGARAAFGLCRPPGHHASSFQFGGYCFLNNAAIAAQSFITGGASRVAVLDVDFHHGNGTQQIFYKRNDVLYTSIHGDPEEAFPHFLGYADEVGMDAGAGFNLNIPFPRGTAWGLWVEGLMAAERRIQEFGAEALIVSLGVDTHKDDPISFFALNTDDYTQLGRHLARLNLPTVILLEGGYDLPSLGENVANTLTGFHDTA